MKIGTLTFAKIDVTKLDVPGLFANLHIASNHPSAPAIALFPSYAQQVPIVFDPREHDVSIRGLANFLLDHKLWSDKEKQQLAESLGQKIDEIMYQPGEDEQIISDKDDLFSLMDKNGDHQVDKIEV
jgi:hypothetical protein